LQLNACVNIYKAVDQLFIMVNLVKGTQPEFSMAPADFREQIEGNKFWGIPLKYFEVRVGRVYMDERLATRINWSIDACQNDYININAPAQKVRIDGRELSIPAGFFCSYVDRSELSDF
jgi:hypothetical protein